MTVTVICGVDRRLLGADVVGPNRSAGVTGPLSDKATSGEEIHEGWKARAQEFF